MLPTGLYRVQWETQARMREEHSVEARKAWLARAAHWAARPTPLEDRSLAESSTLTRLVNALAYAGK